MDGCLVFAVAVLLPVVLASFGLLYGGWDARRPTPSLPRPAGPWIEEQIGAHGWSVAVEIVPAHAPDAFLPATATLALSEATYGGSRPRDYAVAAHELGHASIAARPLLRWLLPGARLVSALAWRLFVGALAISLWLDEWVLEPLAFGALAASVVATVIVCGDEIVASRQARRWLAADPTVSDLALRRATSAMRAAGSAYVLGLVGRAALLAVWPALWAALAGADAGGVRALGHLGTWLVLVTLPVVLIRAGLAVAQVVRPEPVPSELDLWALLQRDSLWESFAASCVVASLVVTHASLAGPGLAIAAAVAAASALGQVQTLLAAIVLVPGLVLQRFWRRRPAPRYAWRARDDVPQAMIAMFSDPPWYLRALWLLPLGYLPLAALMFARLL